MAFTFQERGRANGDTTYQVLRDGVMLHGTVRDSLNKGEDFHAVINRNGVLKSRYFGSRRGAAAWLNRMQPKSGN